MKRTMEVRKDDALGSGDKHLPDQNLKQKYQ